MTGSCSIDYTSVSCFSLFSNLVINVYVGSSRDRFTSVKSFLSDVDYHRFADDNTSELEEYIHNGIYRAFLCSTLLY